MLQKNSKQSASGLTLIEVLVTLVIAVVLGATVMRFYKDSFRSFSLQEQITERNQNAHYVLSKMVEVLQQAGASLPDSGWDSTVTFSNSILTVGSNPKSGQQDLSVGLGTVSSFHVDQFAPFDSSVNTLVTPGFVLLVYANPASKAEKVPITARAKDSVGGGTITISKSVTLNAGDKIYPYHLDQFFLDQNNFCMSLNGTGANQVLAENIDSIGFTFYKTDGVTTTTSWKNARSASILVRARTEKKDPKYSGDGYRKISLSMNFLFKNKV